MRPRALLFAALLGIGCGTREGGPPATAAPGPGTGAAASSEPAAAARGAVSPPSAGPATVGSAGAAPGAGASSAKLVLPADKGAGQFRGLQIDLVEVVEKRMMDGAGMMRATLRLRAAGKEETVEITSDDPKLTWNGYELEYDPSGWRAEVRLTVRRATP